MRQSGGGFEPTGARREVGLTSKPMIERCSWELLPKVVSFLGGHSLCCGFKRTPKGKPKKFWVWIDLKLTRFSPISCGL